MLRIVTMILFLVAAAHHLISQTAEGGFMSPHGQNGEQTLVEKGLQEHRTRITGELIPSVKQDVKLYGNQREILLDLLEIQNKIADVIQRVHKEF